MNRFTPGLMSSLFCILVALCGGCRCCHAPVPVVKVAAEVDVGGLVGQPQSVPIPASGLTLLQALIRAGGVASAPIALDASGTAQITPRGRLIVSLLRGKVQHHFALALVESQSAAGIQLVPSDIVLVQSISQTGIANKSIQPAGQATAMVSGLHSQAGEVILATGSSDPAIVSLFDLERWKQDRQSKQSMTIKGRTLSNRASMLVMSQPIKDEISAMRDQLCEIPPNTAPSSQDSSTTLVSNPISQLNMGSPMTPEEISSSQATLDGVPATASMLVRQNITQAGHLDVYVLPTIATAAVLGPSQFDPDILRADAAVIPGDVVQFTQLEKVPIVTAGLLAPELTNLLKGVIDNCRLSRGN